MDICSLKSNDDASLMNRKNIDLNSDFNEHIYSSYCTKLHPQSILSTTAYDYSLSGVDHISKHHHQSAHKSTKDCNKINNGNNLGLNLNAIKSDEMMSADVKLKNRSLWQKFDDLVNEMILVKKGRRMFPQLEFEILDLDPKSNYCVLIEMCPLGDTCYRFKNKQWFQFGKASTSRHHGKLVEHPESPNTGRFWMKHTVCFHRLRLTNYHTDEPQKIALATMNRYQPRIHIVKENSELHIEGVDYKIFAFPETKFIAVTTYQNQKVIELKTNSNSFASRFRIDRRNSKRKNHERSEIKIKIEEEDLQEKSSDEEIPREKPSSPLKVLAVKPFDPTTNFKDTDKSHVGNILPFPKVSCDDFKSIHDTSLIDRPISPNTFSRLIL